jgi:hypothetical protein
MKEKAIILGVNEMGKNNNVQGSWFVIYKMFILYEPKLICVFSQIKVHQSSARMIDATRQHSHRIFLISIFKKIQTKQNGENETLYA